MLPAIAGSQILDARPQTCRPRACRCRRGSGQRACGRDGLRSTDRGASEARADSPRARPLPTCLPALPPPQSDSPEAFQTGNAERIAHGQGLKVGTRKAIVEAADRRHRGAGGDAPGPAVPGGVERTALAWAVAEAVFRYRARAEPDRASRAAGLAPAGGGAGWRPPSTTRRWTPCSRRSRYISAWGALRIAAGGGLGHVLFSIARPAARRHAIRASALRCVQIIWSLCSRRTVVARFILPCPAPRRAWSPAWTQGPARRRSTRPGVSSVPAHRPSGGVSERGAGQLAGPQPAESRRGGPHPSQARHMVMVRTMRASG
jgi:hypothetical protein